MKVDNIADHIVSMKGPLRYPGGKDGMYVANCSCGYVTAPYGTREAAAKPALQHVADRTTACEVCGDEPTVGVFSVPGVPISMAYGQKCRAANAHPYGILVANTACAGDENEGMAEWWMEMVHATLRHLGKTEDEFWDDVAQARRDMTLAESQTE